MNAKAQRNLKLVPTAGLLLLLVSAAVAQNPLSAALKMSFGDVAATKQKAEAGDPQAQLSLGDILSQNFKNAEAVEWYRKAAGQGLAAAQSRLGEILLFGRVGIPSAEAVKANPSEGIRWSFKAATNHDAKACLNISKALQKGIGLNTNLVEAYAWLQIYADSDPFTGRAFLNQLALRLDAGSLQQAQAQAARFRAGVWPSLSVRRLRGDDSGLKLGGVTVGKTPLAIINGKTLAEGESTIIEANKQRLQIQCIQIKRDMVLVQIEGESEPRWLRLK